MKCTSGLFLLGSIGLLLLPMQAMGNVFPWEEYDKLIDSRTSIESLETDLFGDQVNLYNTGLSFSVTDISLPGNHDLPVALTRTFDVRSKTLSAQKDLPMGTWDLDLPRIEGVFAATGNHPVWPSNRCSGNGSPPAVTVPGGTTYPANQYWHGNHAHMPGGGELIRADQGAMQPATSDNWRWMTSNFTYFYCLGSIQGGGPGEGFLAITSDGTRYWFNRLAQYHEQSLQAPETSDGGPPDSEPPDDEQPDDEHPDDETPDDENTQGVSPLTRKRNVLYATRIEDRFGNYVNYTFTNTYNEPARLTRIEASDGREITLTYNAQGRVATASDGTHTWIYQYSSAGHLSSVTLPDNSQWTINFEGLWDVELEYDADPTAYRDCGMTAPVLGLARGGSGTVTHPSGATGLFEVEHVSHGRSNVPKACINWQSPINDPTDDIAVWPRQYDLLGLKKKRITGPGLAAMEWEYSSGSLRSWAPGTGPICDTPDCDQPVCLDDSCAGTSLTTVNGPDGEWTRYTYGNSYRYNEGKLLTVERGTGPGNILRTEQMQYELAQSGQPFPVPIGTSPNNRGNVFAAAYLTPRSERVISQHSTVFSYTVNSFDSLARPLSVSRYNSQNQTREEVTTYHDHFGRWILGQVESVTMTGQSNGDLVTVLPEETTYSSDYALPLVNKRFGKPVQTLSWDTTSSIASGQRGTIQTVTDGNNNVTTASDWKRGTPQTINYADGESTSALVNDNGTVASVTDENGLRTCYDYDNMRRLAQITYPSETQIGVCNSSTWNVTSQAFEQIKGSEYGIGSGHWRQTVNTGDSYRISYFDALWRPLLTREFDSADPVTTERFNRFEYDHEGRTTYISYPSANSTASAGTRTEYDVLGRVTQVQEDSELGTLTTTTEYLHDVLGYHTKVTDPRNNVTRTWYQAFDEPRYDAALLHTHPEGAYTVFARDFLGQVNWIRRQNLDDNLLAYTDLNELINGNFTLSATRSYVYNSHQELCKIIEPETGATIMAYDSAGNLAWSKEGSGYTSTTNCNTLSIPVSQRTTRQYDERNRIITLSFPDGRGDTSYEYSANGNLLVTSVTNDNSEAITEYGYNRRNLQTTETLSHSELATPHHFRRSSYEYDANGHLTVRSVAVPDRGWLDVLNLDFAPNALGQPTRISTDGRDFVTNVSYHPNGAIKEFTFGNGIVHTMIQNVRGFPDTSADAFGGDILFGESYDYDASGNVAAITDGGTSTGISQRRNRDMVYDGLDRLTSVTSLMFGTATYTYDEVDNLTQISISGGTDPRNHHLCYFGNTNRLAALRTGSCNGSTVTSFNYDAQGNVVGRGDTTFDFDHGNRLREVDGSTTSRYDYDGHGRRVRSHVGQDVTYSMYSSDGRLIATLDQSSGQSSYYVYLGSRLVAVREMSANSTFGIDTYQHTDVLGSPVLSTNFRLTRTGPREHEPYGIQLIPTPSDGPGYTGHLYDAATGLNYMQQRYYDPAIGRFLSVDPVAADPNTGSNFNRYWYANNNPYRFYDPDGRCPGSRLQDPDGDCTFTNDSTTQTFEGDYFFDGTYVSPETIAQSRRSHPHIWGDPAIGEANQNVLTEAAISAIPGAAIIRVLHTMRMAVYVTRGAGPMARGRASETRVLNELGLPKNTQRVRTGEGASIPDALTRTRSIEIKDAANVSLTRQLRVQTEAARASGRQPLLITGERTCVSGPCVQAFGRDNIIRRSDLGPPP